MPLYANHGVGHLWIVDPLAETLEVYRREATRWVVVASYGADDRVQPEPFDAVPFDLGVLWKLPGEGVKRTDSAYRDATDQETRDRVWFVLREGRRVLLLEDAKQEDMFWYSFRTVADPPRA